MFTIDLPDEVARRLAALVEASGRSASSHAEQAISEYLDDLEDYAAAEQEMEDVKAGRSRTVSLDAVMKTYGLAD